MRDRVAHVGELVRLSRDLHQFPGGGRGNLHRSLFGFDVDQVLAFANEFALLFQPSADLHFGDGFAHSGDFDGNEMAHGIRTVMKRRKRMEWERC